MSANTAIQFYDVQDRLGYDRPSKAVDWLIKNAKASIDELEKIPPWHPSTMADVSLQQQQQPMLSTQQEMMMNSDDAAAAETSDSTAYNNAFGGGGSTSTSFLPSPVQSEYSIADTIKSFFPTTGVTASSSNAPIGLYAQDLRLSLQSFQQDPILLHHHSHQNQQSNTTTSEHPFFSSSSSSSSHMPMVYDTIPLVPWHTTGGVEDDGGGGYGYNNFSSPQGMAAMHAGVGQNSFYPPQRGTLQSSDSPYIRAWMDPTLSTSTAGFSGFSRFRIPARIQGDLEEEEQGQDAVSDKPSQQPSSHR